MRTVGKLLRIARKVREQRNPRLALEGIVLTMADSRTTMTTNIINIMRQNFGRYLFRTIVPRTVDLARMASRGEPLVYSHLRSRGAQGYLSLAGELVVRENNGRAAHV